MTNIWNMAQNKPTLIVNDLVGKKADEDAIYEVLLNRGVFKWLGVRRKLIKLKLSWKKKVTDSIAAQKATGQVIKAGIASKRQRRQNPSYWRGYRKALEECRKEIRELCHSDRFQVQDNDTRAAEWLEKKAA